MGKAKLTTTTTVTTELNITPKVKQLLMTELHGYQSFATEQKAFKEAMDKHRGKVLDLGVEHVGQPKFELEGFKVALVTDGEDARLDKVKLVKLLVQSGHYSVKSADALLEKATTRKPKKAHARITCPGEQGDE